MKRLLLILCFLPLLARGANIDFRNLNTNHFTTNGYKVSLKNFPTNSNATNYITALASNYFLTTGGSSTVALTNVNVSWVFTNGNNATFAPGRRDLTASTIGHAVSNSPAGYTIVVGPGNYAFTNNILKAGLNYEFLGAGTVTFSTAGSQTNGIFDDRLISGGTTNVIHAPGWEFTRIFGSGQGEIRSGVLVVANTNSHIVFRAKKCWFQETDSTGENRSGALHIINCKQVIADVDEIEEIGSGTLASFCTPVYWERGEFYLNSHLIKSDAAYCIWGAEPAGSDGAGDNMWATVDRMICPFSYAVWQQGTNSNYRMWVKGHEIEAGYNTFLLTGGKLYVEDFGKLGINDQAVGAVVETFGGELWLTAQKFSSPEGSWLIATNTTIHQFEVGHCEHTGSGTNSANLGGFTLNGGTANLVVGKALRRVGPGIIQRGGTNRIQINLSTAGVNTTTNWPVHVMGGVLTLLNSTLVAPPDTSNAVYATTAQSAFLFNVNMNTNVNPNVIVSGDYGVIGGLQ